MELVFESAFDTNGVLHHIATAGGTQPYANPHTARLVVSSASSGIRPDHSSCCHPIILVERILATAVCNYTSNEPGSWMAVDLGVGRALTPTRYCLRSDDHGRIKIRNWELQGSNDDQEWVTLRKHEGDTSLAAMPMSTADWPIEGPAAATAYRHFRIFQTGPDSRGGQNLTCAGIELYGIL